MKLKNLFLMAALSLCVVGCNNDDLEESFGQSNGNKKITAIFESEPQARTSATDEGIFAWVEGDQIGVWTGNNFSAFTLADGKNTSEATFTGLVNENSTLSGYAVYPYSEEYSHSYVNDKLTITLPAEYGKSNDSYQPNTNAAMIAEISSVSDKMTLRFKHVGGVFRYVVKNVPKGAAKFVFTAEDKNVTGSFEVVEEGGESVIKLDETEPTDDDAVKSNTVTINFKPLEEAAAEMRFYIPVPTGTYGKTTVDVQDKNGTSLGKITDTPKEGTFKLERRDLILAPNKIFPSVGGTLVEDQTVTTDTEATTALAKTTSDPTVSLLPSASVGEFNLGSGFTDGGTTKSQAIVNYNEGVPTTITVNQSGYSTTNPPATAAVSKGKVSISVDTDNITTTDGAVATMQTLNYNTPDLTGEIEATGEKALNIETANVHTSSTTMIIGEKVSIGTLNVKGGNVVIKGKVTTIADARVDKSTPIYVVKEGNATVTNALPEGFYYVSSREEAALRSAFDMATETASTFVLPAGIDITTAGKALELAANKKLILDLNGHTIKATGSKTGQILVLGELEIKDNSSTKTGKIVETTGYAEENKFNLLRAEGENAKIIMSGGTVSFESGVENFGVGLREGADFEMTGGKIEAGYYALAGNGEDKTTNSAISISGGELISTADYAIFLPQAGETNVSDGTIIGACGAIGVRNGTLNVKENATLISNGIGSTGDWKDGTGGSGNAVIAIGTGKHNTYGECTVNISGGTLSANVNADGSINANGNAVVIDKQAAPNNTITVSVTGGTFNDPQVLGYVVEGGNVSVKLTQAITYSTPINFNASAQATLNLNGQTLEYTGCDPANEGGTISAILVKNNAVLTVEGTGTFNSNGYVFGTSSTGNNNTLNLNGNIKYYSTNSSVVNVNKGTANINDGEFKATLDDAVYVLNCKDKYLESNEANIYVNGGKFHKYNPQNSQSENPKKNFLKSGLVAETSEGVFEVLKEVDGEVALDRDLTLYSPIFTTQNVTLDLGNHHLSDGGIQYIKDVQAALIEVYGGELTIKGTGSVKSNETADNYAVFVRNSATVNIEGGIYEGATTAINVNKGTANIKGGTYSQVGYENHNYVINCYDDNYENETAKIVVTGGTFIGFNPGEAKSESGTPSFVAEGYGVTADETKNPVEYTVSAE